MVFDHKKTNWDNPYKLPHTHIIDLVKNETAELLDFTVICIQTDDFLSPRALFTFTRWRNHKNVANAANTSAISYYENAKTSEHRINYP